MGCHGPHQGIFPILGSKLHLLWSLHCRQILYHRATRETWGLPYKTFQLLSSEKATPRVACPTLPATFPPLLSQECFWNYLSMGFISRSLLWGLLAIWLLPTAIRLLSFSHLVVSNSLGPHRLQHTRLLCPPLSPRVYSNSCPLSW